MVIKKILTEAVKRRRARETYIRGVYARDRRKQQEIAEASDDPWVRRVWKVRSVVTPTVELYCNFLKNSADLLESIANKI